MGMKLGLFSLTEKHELENIFENKVPWKIFEKK
jgi:hypothetical protein